MRCRAFFSLSVRPPLPPPGTTPRVTPPSRLKNAFTPRDKPKALLSRKTGNDTPLFDIHLAPRFARRLRSLRRDVKWRKCPACRVSSPAPPRAPYPRSAGTRTKRSQACTRSSSRIKMLDIPLFGPQLPVFGQTFARRPALASGSFLAKMLDGVWRCVSHEKVGWPERPRNGATAAYSPVSATSLPSRRTWCEPCSEKSLVKRAQR